MTSDLITSLLDIFRFHSLKLNHRKSLCIQNQRTGWTLNNILGSGFICVVINQVDGQQKPLLHQLLIGQTHFSYYQTHTRQRLLTI